MMRRIAISAILGIGFIASGAFYGLNGARQLFGARLVPTRYYVKSASGPDVAEKSSFGRQPRFSTPPLSSR